MAQNKFNLSKGDDKKGFNLSKSIEPKASKFNLSKEQTTISESSKSESTRKSKWWLWLILTFVVIIVVILIVQNNSLNSADKNLMANTEKATAKANEIIVDIQNGNVNSEDAQAKVDEAQYLIDEAKANEKTSTEKQAVAKAQEIVDKARETIEQVKVASESKNTIAGESITSSDVEPTEGDHSSNEKPADTGTQSGQPDTSNSSASSTPSQNIPTGTLEEKAKRVIRGEFGNGIDRKNALGSEYSIIQSRVNEMYRNGEVK